MNLADFQRIIQEIAGNLSDQGKVTDLLSQLSDGGTQLYTNLDNATKQIEDQTTQIGSLQKTNMNLFLKVANPIPDDKINTTDKLSYEDLFDEKGELK